MWHRTGDSGLFDQRGRVWLRGRKMEQVIVRDGEEHHPNCIEQPFHKHPSVERAALIKLIKYGILFLALAILPKMRRGPFSFG
jgi:acyl-CoA synthetase (AMP-forming)/AMP-acid ligase II